MRSVSKQYTPVQATMHKSFILDKISTAPNTVQSFHVAHKFQTKLKSWDATSSQWNAWIETENIMWINLKYYIISLDLG